MLFQENYCYSQNIWRRLLEDRHLAVCRPRRDDPDQLPILARHVSDQTLHFTESHLRFLVVDIDVQNAVLVCDVEVVFPVFEQRGAQGQGPRVLQEGFSPHQVGEQSDSEGCHVDVLVGNVYRCQQRVVIILTIVMSGKNGFLSYCQVQRLLTCNYKN